MPPATKGKTTPNGKPAPKPTAKPAAADQKDQHEPVPQPLRTYGADLVSDDGAFRAFVHARDEAGAREILAQEASNLRVRGIWVASESPALLALFKSESLL